MLESLDVAELRPRHPALLRRRCRRSRPTPRVLVTLLHLRDIADKTRQRLLDRQRDAATSRNRALAEVTQADDFIVSEQLVSLMLSQISENKELERGLRRPLRPRGLARSTSSRPSDYVATGTPVNFYTVVEAARRRGEVAIGYRLLAAAEDPARAYGVVVNPDKGDRVTFAAADKVIVLAES